MLRSWRRPCLGASGLGGSGLGANLAGRTTGVTLISLLVDVVALTELMRGVLLVLCGLQPPMLLLFLRLLVLHLLQLLLLVGFDQPPSLGGRCGLGGLGAILVGGGGEGGGGRCGGGDRSRDVFFGSLRRRGCSFEGEDGGGSFGGGSLGGGGSCGGGRCFGSAICPRRRRGCC